MTVFLTNMDSIVIIMMVSGPVIAIGTALYLWRQRAVTTWERRRRGLLVLASVLSGLLAARIYMWSESGQSWKELGVILFVFAFCLAYPSAELLSQSARHKEDK